MNVTATKMATSIVKENITQLTFPKNEVLGSKLKIEERTRRIIKGMKLGNNKKIKVKILFEDASELKRVETTIWGITDKNIILKRGTIIPIQRIHEIKFF
jgi:hypothetical protein